MLRGPPSDQPGDLSIKLLSLTTGARAVASTYTLGGYSPPKKLSFLRRTVKSFFGVIIAAKPGIVCAQSQEKIATIFPRYAASK
jgi:hypothetical protein